MARIFSHVEVQVRSSEASDTNSSSTGPSVCDYTPVRRRPSHCWTLEDRIALCVLNRWYANSTTDIATVLAEHFPVIMEQSPVRDRLSGSAMSTQFYELSHLGENSQAFAAVYLETLFADEHCRWTSTRHELEQKAKEVGIELIRKQWEDRSTLLKICSRQGRTPKGKKDVTSKRVIEFEDTPSTSKKRCCYLPTPSTSTADRTHQTAERNFGSAVHQVPQDLLIQPRNYQAIQSSLRSSLNLQESPHHNARTPSRRFISPRTPSSSSQTNQDQSALEPATATHRLLWGATGGQFTAKQPRAQLAFRFYDDNSSGINSVTRIRAGAFERLDEIPQPAVVNSEEFRIAATKHLTRVREPTPFISLYESLLPVLHRALRSTANASVAILDLHIISKYQGDSIFSAAKTINDLGLRDDCYRYRGRTEWLVWGSIPGEAILSTFRINILRDFLQSAPDVDIALRLPEIEHSENAKAYRKALKENPNQVNEPCGRVVGKFIAFIGLPDFYIKKVTAKIARDWKLKGNSSIPRLRLYAKGVELGIRQVRGDRKAPDREISALEHDRKGSHVSKLACKVDDFCERRRYIEATCSGSGISAGYLSAEHLPKTSGSEKGTKNLNVVDQAYGMDEFSYQRQHIEKTCEGIGAAKDGGFPSRRHRVETQHR